MPPAAPGSGGQLFDLEALAGKAAGNCEIGQPRSKSGIAVIQPAPTHHAGQARSRHAAAEVGGKAERAGQALIG